MSHAATSMALSTSTSTKAASSTHTTSGATSNILSEALSLDSQSGQTVTKFQVVTTSLSGVGVEVTLLPNGNGGLNVGATGSNISVGAIVGAVVGSVAFLLLLILSIVLCLRRRRRAAAVLSQSGQDGESGGGMRESNAHGGAF